MKKPIVRQLKKVESGNELVVCVAPENRKKLGANEGDNLLQMYNPDSGVVEISRVAQSPNRQQSETREDAEDETREKESIVDLPGKKEQGQQTEISGFEFCSSCGSKNIEVAGDRYYCGDCDVTYKVTSKGTIPIDTNPSLVVDALEERVEQLEEDVDKLNGNSDKDENSGVLFSLFGIDFGFVNGTEDDEDEDLVPVGSESDEDEDEEPDGFISLSL